jgi:hypothetical protein
MNYESWRVTFQSSEQAARTAFAELAEVKAQRDRLADCLRQPNPDYWMVHISFGNYHLRKYFNQHEAAYFSDAVKLMKREIDHALASLKGRARTPG